MVPRLLPVDGRFIVMPDVSLGQQPRYGRHGSRKSSRRSSRASSQLHGVGRDTDLNVTPDVTECDSSEVIDAAAAAAVADADARESTADNGLCCAAAWLILPVLDFTTSVQYG